MRDLGRIASDGLTYPSSTHWAVRKHHKRFVAAFGDRSYRAYSDNARDQRYELQFLRLLLAARGALSLPHASHHVYQSLFREEDGLRRIAKSNRTWYRTKKCPSWKRRALVSLNLFKRIRANAWKIKRHLSNAQALLCFGNSEPDLGLQHRPPRRSKSHHHWRTSSSERSA